MSFGRLLVIANPRAGRGAVARAWPAVAAALTGSGVEHDVSFTTAPGHAIEIARDAVARGVRFIAAMGGDGTVHEVVNGLMGEQGARSDDIVLGLLPSGTGCDLARTFGIPQDPVAAAVHLAGDGVWGRLDVGRVRVRAPDGSQRSRWFINVAEAGIGAAVVASAAKMPGWLGGRAYRLAAMKAIATFRPRAAHVEMNGRDVRRTKVGSPLGRIATDATVTMLVVANGQFFGGGLRVAPRAIPSDAMFDVLIGEGTKADAVRALQKMPRGAHVPDRTIAEYLADSVHVDADGLAVEADGELIGMTPATFDLVADAITLKI